LNLGETDRAEAALQLSLSHCQALGDTWAGSHILSHLAVVPLRRGDYELAVDYAQQALTGTRETGDHLATYVSLLVLAQAAQASGDIDRATRYFAEAIEVAAAVSDRVNASYSLQGLAEVAVSRGDLERAARLLAAAEAILETTNSPRYAYVPDRRLNENLARTVRARLGEEAWDAASKEGRAVGLDGAVRYALAD
jgi:non-specific serine/threonine protein kinase